MENTIIDLAGIKIVCFDFDNTLAMHTNKNYEETRKVDIIGYFSKAYTSPETFYKEVEPCIANPDMFDIISFCRLFDRSMFIVSGMRFNLHLKAKTHFIEENYGDGIPFLMADSQPRKLEVMQVLSRSFGVEPSEMLLIDDVPANVEAARKAGFQAMEAKDVKKVVFKGKSLTEIMDD